MPGSYANDGLSSAALLRVAALAVSGLVALTLAACSPGDVALNGKVFDAVGSLNGNTGDQEVKIAARPGLVVPPNLQNLPAPGSEKVPEGQLANINDPDLVKKASPDKSVLKAQQDAYCKEHYDVPKAHGDDVTADAAVGPMGPCRKSALGLLGDQNPLDWFNKK